MRQLMVSLRLFSVLCVMRNVLPATSPRYRFVCSIIYIPVAGEVAAGRYSFKMRINSATLRAILRRIQCHRAAAESLREIVYRMAGLGSYATSIIPRSLGTTN